MAELYYKIEFFSDWHTGSGLAAGADVDLLVIKDNMGFPYIPGKTLKGLIRDAARELCEAGVVANADLEQLFGAKDAKDEGRPSMPGLLYFTNAELTKNLKEKLKDKQGVLYRKVSSTAIAEDGQAREHTLRRIEVTVPLTLFARIDNIRDGADEDILTKSMSMIKRLGSWRNRGYGRCAFSVVAPENGGTK